MARRGRVKVDTTVSDVWAAVHWLCDHARSAPRGTVLTGEPDMAAWERERNVICRLAAEMSDRAARKRRSSRFLLVIERERLAEFQRAYAPAWLVRRASMSGLILPADRFAAAVDQALSGRAGRPTLSRQQRQVRLSGSLSTCERHTKRLRRQDRIEAERHAKIISRRGTVLTGGMLRNST